ncbi:hypothetical protein RhiirA1_470904 [Rhizophagus irregularis]|uniref:Uncharacterized protein n=1 Tax=Rhizophagus irregularis TaxID=588596 RepID=A0A2N0R5B2_9GLOM|nr:hypothetical protein RhiirA1_470904 [Rhizophagus irregularis]
MKYHWDNECSKAKTPDGSARLIQKAYRNYRKRPVLLAKQVWEAVRNDNTSREKKFLSMPSRDTRCTVNLDIWYSIDGLYRPFNIPLDQFYDYISYSKHKRCQLSDRLAIARNKIQCNYIMSSAPNFEPAYISPAKQEMISLTSYQLSNCKSDTGGIFILSQYAKQPKGTMLRLRDGRVITVV